MESGGEEVTVDNCWQNKWTEMIQMQPTSPRKKENALILASAFGFLAFSTASNSWKRLIPFGPATHDVVRRGLPI